MVDTNFMETLLEKKLEFEKEINIYQTKLDTLTSQLNSLVDTISIFTIDQSQIRNSYFKRGECRALILQVLKKHNKPLLSTQIVEEVRLIKQIELNSKKEKINFNGTVNGSMSTMRKRNMIEVIKKEEGVGVWQIKPINS